MTVPRYKGLTWDHPRGYVALQAAAAEVAAGQGVAIDWDIQPLEGFESAPIGEICSRYDLVVLDHPHIGEAIEAGCLTPLEQVFDTPTLAAFAATSIGPTYDSYRYDGRSWGLPLDAATQICAYRADLVDGEVPATWDEALAFATKGKLAMSLAGPHAILTFLSICVALGEEPGANASEELVGEGVGVAAFEVLSHLGQLSVPSVRQLNPIGIYEHMSRHDDVALCPTIFGYVNYARADDGRKAVRFIDTPRHAIGGRPGTVLGGTGIGITTQCQVTPELVRHLSWLMGANAQVGFIPDHAGQPSRRDAWNNPTVNSGWGNFYADTAETIERAYVRPRHSGYIAWQTSAAAYVREAIDGNVDAKSAVRHLNKTFKTSVNG